MLNKNKLKVAAAATLICAGGAFGVLEADSDLSSTLGDQKVECYTNAPDQAEDCVKAIDATHQSEYIVIEALEIGLLLGAAACGLEFAKTLRKV